MWDYVKELCTVHCLHSLLYYVVDFCEQRLNFKNVTKYTRYGKYCVVQTIVQLFF